MTHPVVSSVEQKGNALRSRWIGAVGAVVAAIAGSGCANAQSTFYREVEGYDLRQPLPTAEVVQEADIAALPPATQRYFRFMGAVGRPRVWSLRASFEGRFKLSRDGRWMSCETIQYNSKEELARLFYMTLHMGPIPLLGRDTYRSGKGRMLGRALDLFTVVDGSGPEFDTGELVTYLNDAILLAPSMLLGPDTTWAPVDDRAFDVGLTDHGRTVRARVFLDEMGGPKDFSTTDRFFEDPKAPGHYVRSEWRTPVEGFWEVGGRRFPRSGKAVWHPKGEDPFAYADFQLLADTVVYNVAPIAPLKK